MTTYIWRTPGGEEIELTREDVATFARVRETLGGRAIAARRAGSKWWDVFPRAINKGKKS